MVRRLAVEGANLESDRRLFEPVRPIRSFETAISSILDGVERNRIRRGDRLPTERQLASQLEISIPTLRQALVVLQRAGVVDVRPGKAGGIFLVTDLIPADALSEAVAVEEGSALDILRARRVLEPAVTRYAMRVATEDDFAEIERTVDLVRAHLGERAQVFRADAMFHRAVVRACGNETLQAAMQAVARGLAPMRDAYAGGIERDQETLEIHSTQLAAMRAGDEDGLAEIMDRHLRILEEVFAAAAGRAWDDLFGASVSASERPPAILAG